MQEDYDLRRGGRVAEGARLESVYRVYSPIEGSNPSPSAIPPSKGVLLPIDSMG